MSTARKPRGDMKVSTLEKKLGYGPGLIRNADGSDARGDKLIGTLRKEYAQASTRRNPLVSKEVQERADKVVRELMGLPPKGDNSKKKVTKGPSTVKKKK